MSYEQHVFAFLGVCRMAAGKDVANLFCILNGMEQWRANRQAVEKGTQIVGLLAQPFHLNSVSGYG